MEFLCRIMQVTSRGFRAWRCRPMSQRQRDDMGFGVGHRRGSRFMRENGIKIVSTQKYKATTDSDQTFNIAPNLPDQDFSADGPNQQWAGDISDIWTSEGWLFLAVILDLYSRRVIGWAVSNRMKRDGRGAATAVQGLHSPYGSRVAILFRRLSETAVYTWLEGLYQRQRKLLRQFHGRNVFQISSRDHAAHNPVGQGSRRS